MRLDFTPTEEQRKLAIKKSDEIIDLLSNIKDIRLKAFILRSLIDSFKDISGIDICNYVKIEFDKKEGADVGEKK